ncbi:MAG: bifunctional folylpolyglutamate synthase/dihydrofolate synthase [Marinilabiliaceae bacterium]|nr:bifunctional folylpolyglutamate synthase/dihydrofolate synthase [Marinilabiliaceae bacterium]
MKKYNTYKDAINFLFTQLPMYQRIGSSAYKANLINTIKLDEYFNHPHKNFKSIHIAGTNGKGSVSHMLASVLYENGYKVGLYTSPHLIDFRERIQVNGIKISTQHVTDFINQNHSIIEQLNPSFFEITVAMAFDHFAKEKVDIAVIEVGMGGRLDSTNIITPLLSVITNIGLDHTQFLGNSLSLIAAEKGGIIKPDIPVVVGSSNNETHTIFEKIASTKHSKLIEAEKKYQIPYSTQSIDNKQIFQVYNNDKLLFPNLKTDLLGIYQRKNTCTVLTSIDILTENGLKISTEAIYNGIANTKKNTNLMGRWHILGYNPLTICDIAHNYDGIKEIVAQLNETPYQNLHFVIGFVQDKNIDEILTLLPKNATYYFTRANIPRSLNEKELKNAALKHQLSGSNYPNVHDAIVNAKKNSSPNDLIFIGGSTFVVAEAI